MMRSLLFHIGTLSRSSSVTSLTNRSSKPSRTSSFNSQPVNFGSPFDAKDADIILRSSDEIDFYFYRAVLRKASPIFKRILAASPCSSLSSLETTDHLSDEKEGLHVVTLEESSPVVLLLLSLLLTLDHVDSAPAQKGRWEFILRDPIRPTSADDAVELVHAAHKYDMDIIFSKAASFLGDNLICTPDNSLRIYATAHHFGLRDETMIAARATLDLPLAQIDTYLSSDPNWTPGYRAYDELFEYRQACASALDAYLLKSFNSSTDLTSWMSHTVCLGSSVERNRCSNNEQAWRDMIIGEAEAMINDLCRSPQRNARGFSDWNFRITSGPGSAPCKTCSSCYNLRNKEALKEVGEALVGIARGITKEITDKIDVSNIFPELESWS